MGVAKIVYMDFPPVPKSSMNSENEGLPIENERLKFNISVLKSILKSYKQYEMDSNDGEPNVKKFFGEDNNNINVSFAILKTSSLKS
jgi:hypothetical protein